MCRTRSCSESILRARLAESLDGIPAFKNEQQLSSVNSDVMRAARLVNLHPAMPPAYWLTDANDSITEDCMTINARSTLDHAVQHTTLRVSFVSR